jgi:N6-L-threonylcarbamoyladenine synthase
MTPKGLEDSRKPIKGRGDLRALTVLGIETSCDETAAAVVRGFAPGPGEILSNIVFSQLDEHRPYGGVVPEIASRAHVEKIDAIVVEALTAARVRLSDVDLIAATAGPGLIGGVLVGLTTAKGLALAAAKPLVAVNHLEAHALTARLTDAVAFPFLLLLISGGHCQLLGVEGVGRFRLYGTTIDDAVGEAFDKTAKLLRLPYPGGPRIEALAEKGNAKRYALPRPMRGRDGADFSFSGLKTAVRQLVQDGETAGADIAASFQSAVIDILVERTGAAMAMFRADFPDARDAALVVAGGVASNHAIRQALIELASREGFEKKIPPPGLCTDNAAMVAWAGVENGQLGYFDGIGVSAKARWPLAGAPPGGSMGAPAKGLIRS